MYICKYEFFHKSSISLFNISTSTATASSIGTDGYKLTVPKKVCISLGDIFHSFTSSKNEEKFKTLDLFLFKVVCIVLTKYFEVPYGGDPIIDTIAVMG